MVSLLATVASPLTVDGLLGRESHRDAGVKAQQLTIRPKHETFIKIQHTEWLHLRCMISKPNNRL